MEIILFLGTTKKMKYSVDWQYLELRQNYFLTTDKPFDFYFSTY